MSTTQLKDKPLVTTLSENDSFLVILTNGNHRRITRSALRTLLNFLPTVSAADNGKILRVENGNWEVSNEQDISGLEAGNEDSHLAVSLLLNFVRQIGWAQDDILAWLDKTNTVYVGSVTLTNSQEFPFNDSAASVSIGATLDNTYYEVQTKVTAFSGNLGEIEVFDKLTNGFKLAYTGSAASATIAWAVIPQSTTF